MAGHLLRRLFAEAIGTTPLIVFGPGSVVAALFVGKSRLGHAGTGPVSLLRNDRSGRPRVRRHLRRVSIRPSPPHSPWAGVLLAEIPDHLVARLVGGLLVVAVFGAGGRAGPINFPITASPARFREPGGQGGGGGRRTA